MHARSAIKCNKRWTLCGGGGGGAHRHQSWAELINGTLKWFPRNRTQSFASRFRTTLRSLLQCCQLWLIAPGHEKSRVFFRLTAKIPFDPISSENLIKHFYKLSLNVRKRFSGASQIKQSN